MKRLFVMLVLGTMAWASVRSQSPVSGIEYFQPGYSYRHLLNPAFVPLCGYVGIPVLGNLNASVGSNMGLSTLLYPLSDGSLGTFMHPEVDADAFMKKIHRRNYAGMDFQTALLSGGWFMGKSFWNVNVSVRGMLQMGLPYEFFEFAKKGMQGNPSEYTMENLEFSARAYLELAVGYARPIHPDITVGGKFKFLVGLTEMEFRAERVDAYLSEDVWKVNSSADLQVFGRLIDPDWPDRQSLPYLTLGDVRPSGYGIAVDMGAEYRPSFLPGLRFSLSLLDLGFLAYPAQDITRYSASGEVQYDGLEEIGPGLDVEEAIKNTLDDMFSMFDFGKTDVEKSVGRMLNPVLNMGVEYALWNNRFSVGLLNTTTFHHCYTENELSVVANLRPVRWFSFSLAYSFLAGANGLGWALNFSPDVGLNLFLASNYLPLSVSPQLIPLKRAHADIQFGLVVPLGRNRLAIEDKNPMDVNVFPYTPKDSFGGWKQAGQKGKKVKIR